MAKIASYTKRFLDLYHRVLKVLLTLLMAGMIIPVGLQILSRYTDLVARYMWTEEAARFCFVWVVMIGSMVAVRDGSHFKVDLLPRSATRRGQARSDLVVHVAMLSMALVFLWFGVDFACFGFDQRSEMSGINMLSIYVSFPLAGGTWALFLLERVAADLRSLAGKRESSGP